MTRGTRLDVGSIKYLYVDCKESTLAIAKILGIPQDSIRYHLRQLGLMRSPTEAGLLASLTGRRIYNPKVPKYKHAEIRKLYEDEGLSTHELAQRHGVTGSTIVAYLHKTGSKLRSPSEGRTLALNQGKFKMPVGKEHHSWKGGIGLRGDGYVTELCKGHPRASKTGYVLQHILIWERTFKESVPHGMVIHHLNGIRSDNRPENLCKVLPGQHGKYTLIHLAQQRIRELEAQLGHSGIITPEEMLDR